MSNKQTKESWEEEELAIQLHGWYLEATHNLTTDVYNPDAQVSYDMLTENQKYIDRYIAKKLKERESKYLKVLREIMNLEDYFNLEYISRHEILKIIKDNNIEL